MISTSFVRAYARGLARLAATLGACAVLAFPAMAAVTVNKQFTPATIDPGDVSVLRISFFNSALVPLTAAAITDNLPAQVSIANPPGVVNTCGFASVTATAGTQRVIASAGTIPAGTGIVDGECHIEVNVVSTAAGNWQNTIPANGPASGFTPGGTVSGFQATEGAVVVTNTTSATATLAVRGLLNPTGSKTFAPSPALVNEPVTLTVTLTNPNAGSTIPLTTFTDSLPAGMQVAAIPNGSVNCTGAGAVNGSLTATSGSSSVTLTGGTIGAGGTCVVTVSVIAPTITGTSQTLTNTVPANAIGNSRGLGSATFNRALVVNSPVTLAKSFVTTAAGNTAIANPIPVNQVFWLRVDITNASTVNPLNITTFTDTFPAGMVVAAGTPTVDCTSNGGGTNGTLTATLGAGSFTLTGGSVGITGATRRCRINVPVMLTAAGSFANVIAVNAVGNTNGVNTPTVTATANGNAQLTVTKTVNPANVAPGQPTQFTLTINNYSAGAVSGVTLTDNLPNVSGNQMVIATPNGFTASAGCVGGTFGNAPGSSSLTWTGGTIVAGSGLSPGQCVIRFNAVAPAGTPIGAVFTNSMPAGSVTGTGGIGQTNNTAVNVTMVSAASVTKQFSPTSAVLGGTSTVIVTLSNQSGASLTNASITDPLPAGVVVAATPAASTTCAGGTVTATPGASTFSLAGATVPTAGCTFRANVVVNTNGNKTNTIPAGALANDQGASNPAPAAATLTVTSALTATKSFSPPSVASGGVSQVTIRVNNVSSIPFTNLSVTDGPMTNLVVATPAGASTTCAGSPVITAAPGTNTVTMTGATLAAGGNCELLFNVRTTGTPANWPNNLPIGSIPTAEGAQNPAAVNATLGRLTTVSISVNKSFNPVSVSGGQPSRLTIDLVNPVTSPGTVTNVTLTDNLPSGMEVYPTPNIVTNCTNATVTAVPGSSVVTISGATIPVATTCSVTLSVTSTRFLNLTNTIPVGAVTSTEGLTNALATSATLSTLQGLGVTKGFSPTSVSIGQPSTMAIRVISTLDPSAPVPVTLHNVGVTDVLPAGVVVAPLPNTSTTCTNGTVTATAGSANVALSGVTLPPGTNCFMYVDVVASAEGSFVNVIPASTMTSTEGYSNASPAEATLVVVPPPTVTKSFAPGQVLPGVVSTATIVVHNSSSLVTLHNVALVDTLPGGLFVAPTPNVSVSCGGGAVSAPASGSTISLTNGVIPPNGDCTIQVDVRSNIPGSYPNTIPAGGVSTAEGVTNTAPGSATLQVLGPPNVVKAFAPDTIGIRGLSRFTIALGNPNAVTATLSAPLVDTLPANVTIAAAPNLGGTCTLASVAAPAGGGSVSYASGAAIPAGGCTIAVDVTSVVPGAYTNVIPAGSLVTNAGTNASQATAPLTVTALPPTLGKTIAPAAIAIGGTATLTITLGNDNATAIQLTGSFTDPMPAGVTTVGGNTGTCAGVSVGASSISVANGTSIAAGGCTIVVTITSSTPGTVVNTTDALATSVGNAPAASAPLTVSAPPTLAKSFAPTSIALGDTSTLTIVVGNANPAPLTLTAAFVDTMPAGVSIVGGNAGTCAGVSATPASLTMASGTAVPSGGCTIVVPVTSSTPGTVTNTTGSLPTTAGTAPPASAQLTVTALAPALAKTIAPGVIGVGGAATLTLTLTNPNNVPIALASAFTDAMPGGVTIAGAISGTCAGVTATTTLITMAAGTALAPGSCTIVATVTSSVPGPYLNTTSALATNAGTAPAASAPLLVNAPPALGKSIAPSSIAIGATATLTLTLGNPNPTPIALTAPFTDPMPSGVTITGALTGTCAGASSTTTSITVAAGTTLAPGSCTVVATITSSTPGTVTNVTGTLDTSSGTAPPAQAPLTVTAVPSTIGKAIAPSTIVAGGTSTLTITLGNANAVPITLTAPFTDAMPSGVTIAGATSGTCPGVTSTPTLVTMASGSSIPVGGCTIVATVTSATPGTVTNTTGTLTTNAGVSLPASAPLTVTAANATLTKTIAPATIAIGNAATLTIAIGNPNATPLTLQAPFTDAMPAGVTLTGANSGTCTGVTNTPTLVTVASGTQVAPGGCTIVYAITSSTPGTVTNTTSALVTEAGSVPPASAPITVTATGPTLGKTIAPASIPAGGTATLTITFGNANASAITLTAGFTDTMPAGVTTTGTNSGTCTGVSVTATAIGWPIGASIPAGGCAIVVTVTSTTVGTVTNTTSDLETNAGTAAPASAPLTVTASTAGLAKAIAPASIAAGGTATLTITLANTTSSPLTLTAPFVDTMPAGVTTTGGNSGTCAGVTVASAAVTMASGSAVPAGGCTIVVNITSSTIGTVTNTTGTLVTTGGSAPPANAPVTVLSPPTLAKSIAPPTIAAGGIATLTLALGNANAAPIALTAPFSDVMPAGVTTTSGNTGTCTAVTVTPTTVTKASGTTIPVGGCTIVVTVTSSTTGTVTNTTGSLATEAGSAPPASAPLTVTGGGGVASLDKTIVPGLVAPGGMATLTIAIGNSGSGPLVLTAPFTDPMPAGMTVASSNTGTCAGVTTAPALITMAAGTAVPPGGCTIVVSVTSSTPGGVTNVTSALVAGSVTAPAASAPFRVDAAPLEVPVDSPLALLLTALLVAATAARAARRRTR
jgi:uncharacterized repeat protein (TIGR01451 family)